MVIFKAKNKSRDVNKLTVFLEINIKEATYQFLRNKKIRIRIEYKI